MKKIHKLVLALKIIFIILLILINIIHDFTKESPIFIITHDLLIIVLCLYLFYISFPFRRSTFIEMEKEDFLFIFIVSLMLLKTIDFRELASSFRFRKNKHSDPETFSVKRKKKSEYNYGTRIKDKIEINNKY